ncbi:MAG: biotin--[acetyl-CoA-carboxylase] ligase [Lachnospiraceae bacterium]|nr:biotin--[acetyl-CoA-carboxylase] ligase [Lachnospiraceae bacterium]
MKVKDEVLKKLEENKGDFFSGASLANDLKVSRNAIWKAVNSLKNEGYNISSVTNKGYCLSNDSDIISKQSISKYIATKAPLDIQVFQTVTSTNTVLKEMAAKGAAEGTVVIATNQTNGRGRLGRSFHSPADTGIYFSILLRPKMSAENSLFLTTSAAVAIAKAIEDVKDCRADIKWVNDIYINNKKVCGILTEGSFNVENNELDYAIVGIGINILPPKDDFPEDIKNKAGAIFSQGEDVSEVSSKLVAHVLNYFFDYYNNLTSKSFFEEYKSRSFLLGKDIHILDGNGKIPATAIDLDESCHLIVRLEDGTTKELSSGEVSVIMD